MCGIIPVICTMALTSSVVIATGTYTKLITVGMSGFTLPVYEVYLELISSS